jgi:hypothetical protein
MGPFNYFSTNEIAGKFGHSEIHPILDSMISSIDESNQMTVPAI